jgi:predicted small lipoprotein YifL
MRILILLLFLSLAACGQKGPLYIEDAPASSETEQVEVDNDDVDDEDEAAEDEPARL